MKEIELAEDLVAMVDDRDFEELSRFKWYPLKDENTYYAVRPIWVGGKQTSISMHRTVLSPTPTEQVDHRDGNGLNNMRSNLRIATREENMRNSRFRKSNTTGFKGVSFHRPHKKWYAHIRHSGKKHHLGCFSSPEEAHAAYCTAAQQFHKEFARVA